MQTFLPYESFEESARILDRRRLGKQRVEAVQLLNVLMGRSHGWSNHPACRMWRGHERALAQYGIAICEEWILRGYSDSQMPLIQEWLPSLLETGMPSWLGRRSFHLSHQSNLLRKMPEHYAQFFQDVPYDLPYEWPDA